MTTLIVTEKPKVAERIANSIGNPKKKSKDGVEGEEIEKLEIPIETGVIKEDKPDDQVDIQDSMENKADEGS